MALACISKLVVETNTMELIHGSERESCHNQVKYTLMLIIILYTIQLLFI